MSLLKAVSKVGKSRHYEEILAGRQLAQKTSPRSLSQVDRSMLNTTLIIEEAESKPTEHMSCRLEA